MAIDVLQLPNEVLLDVFEQLSQSDHAALCKASKGLRRVAEPLLYREIQMRWDEMSYDPPIALLLRTILDRPELSFYVRSLKLTGRFYKGQHVPKPTLLTITTALPEDKLVTATSSIGVSPDMPNEIRSGNADAFITLLVAKLENMESLYLDVNWTKNTRFIGSLLKTSFRSRAEVSTMVEEGPHPKRPSLKALRKVYLVTHECEGSQGRAWPRDTRDGLGLFYLPSIEHLTLAIANPPEFSWPFKCAPSPSHLTSLELYRVRECYLGSVLSVLGGLQKLRYIWNYQADIDTDVSEDVVNLNTMAAAIVQAKDTLTDLKILARPRRATAWGEQTEPEIRMEGSLVGLSRLHKLKTLTVPWTFLAGLDEAPTPGIIGAVLAPSVEYLNIVVGPGSCDDDFFYDWDNDDYLSSFEAELNSGALAHCKCLRTVKLPGFATWMGPTLEEKAKLETLGNAFGITVLQGASHADIKTYRLGDGA